MCYRVLEREIMQEIIAIREVSLSELYVQDKKYTEKYAQENPDTLKWLLFDLGVDTGQHYEHQFNTHRNRFNEVYTGSRWVGLERSDKQWCESGYASQAVIDKVKGSRLLTDLYAQKGLTTGSVSQLWEDEKQVEEKDAETFSTSVRG